ncbi:membrane protein YoeI [Klebsiella sp. RIT-PI-d]
MGQFFVYATVFANKENSHVA